MQCSQLIAAATVLTRSYFQVLLFYKIRKDRKRVSSSSRCSNRLRQPEKMRDFAVYCEMQTKCNELLTLIASLVSLNLRKGRFGCLRLIFNLIYQL